MKGCKICRIELTEDEFRICNPCYYGMRLDAKNWIEDMKARGIEVERGMGCVPVGNGFVCGDPYRRKPTKALTIQNQRRALGWLGLLILFLILLLREK